MTRKLVKLDQSTHSTSIRYRKLEAKKESEVVTCTDLSLEFLTAFLLCIADVKLEDLHIL